MRVRALVLLVALCGCYQGAPGQSELSQADTDAATGSTGTVPDQGGSTTADPAGAETGSTGAGDPSPGDGTPLPATYRTVGDLFTEAMAPTCSPNEGVCHNSDAYPDLHTLTNVISTIAQPCNSNVELHDEVHDFCEPPGDRLVFAELGIDVEIAYVRVLPEGAETAELTSVEVVLAAPVAALPPIDDVAAEVHRDSVVFFVGATGARVTEVSQDVITFDLSTATDSTRAFFDDRVYPWHDQMIRVADVNQNGTLGDDGRMLVPGSPWDSYLVLRLFDESYGDMMPRQCRTWSDEATRALGCFVAMLDDDTDPLAIDPALEIDYENCDFDPIGQGICGTGNDIEDIAARSCGGAGCHVDEAQPAAGLDLSAGVVRDSLIGVPSTQVSGRLLVDPGNPQDSYLLCKLRDSCQERIGTRMPSLGDPLSAAEIEEIERWIEDGAD